MPHDGHHHDHDHTEPPHDLALRTKALESLLMRAKSGLKQALTEQGIIKGERKYG